MGNSAQGILQRYGARLRRLLSRYPLDHGVRPQSFAMDAPLSHQGLRPDTIAIQSVPDKFYFLLFGAILAKLRNRTVGRAELVVVRAVSGAIGSGFGAEIKRSALLAWLWSGPWVRAYGHLVDGVAYRCATWAHPVQDVADWFKSKALWYQLQRQGEHFSLQVDGVEVGDLLIDSYLRFKPSPEFDVKDAFVRRLIWQALRDVRQAQAYFSRVRPRWYLTSYTTYLEHGIPARVALQQGVEVWSFGNLNSFGKRLSQADSFHTQDFSSYKATFDTLDRQDELLEVARAQLERRLAGGIDAATSYMRHSAYGQLGAEVPAGIDGAVVIFLHDFYDSPHVYPELVFDDFWRWINFTIEVLQRARINFFLKPHPNQIALSDEALGRLRQERPELQWLEVGVSNVELARAGMACGVTVYGTVAHELAYLGVPTIGCARHPHHAFDFCRTARSLMEYENMLLSYRVVPISKFNMQRQALEFYYMHNLHEVAGARELQLAFVHLWKSCNIAENTHSAIMLSFSELTNLSAFENFLTALIQ